MARIPYVIDNDQHKLADVLNQVLDAHRDLAIGEIFSARQAKDHGLIDELGFIEDAIDRALELADLRKERTRVVEYEQPPSLFDLPFASDAEARPSALGLILDLNTPQAYYLATTLPPLVTQRSGVQP